MSAGAEQAVSTDSRVYLFSDAVLDWENDNSPNTAVRSYFDASGRLAYRKDQYQNMEQTRFDPLGRSTGLIRYAGGPGSATLTASQSQTLDAWGRVTKEVDNCADALASTPASTCRVRLYTYLPTGELASAMQAPSSDVPGGTLGVSNVYGSLGRLTERDLVSWSGGTRTLTIDGVFQYDAPAAGLGGTRSLGAAGRMASATNDAATLFFGYAPRFLSCVTPGSSISVPSSLRSSWNSSAIGLTRDPTSLQSRRGSCPGLSYGTEAAFAGYVGQSPSRGNRTRFPFRRSSNSISAHPSNGPTIGNSSQKVTGRTSDTSSARLFSVSVNPSLEYALTAATGFSPSGSIRAPAGKNVKPSACGVNEM